MTSKYSNKTGGSELVAQFASQVKDKVILTTGVSPGGLGAAFVAAIAKASPKLLILANRSTDRAEATATKIKEVAPGVNTRILELDLGSFKSVRKAAEEVNKYCEAIDVLVNNAGIMAVPYRKTEDGLESQLQTNHLSHFLFTNLIMDKIIQSGPSARVISISSSGYYFGHVRYYDYNFHDGESYHTWAAYGASKTANILFARELAKRLGKRGLTSVSLHPGVIWTNLVDNGAMTEFENQKKWLQLHGFEDGWTSIEDMELMTPDQGIARHVYASFAPDVNDFNGRYMEDLNVIPTPEENIQPWALGEIESRKCWELSEKLVGQKFSY